MNKRTQQKEQRRKLILEAGLLVFTRQGFAAARLDQVAELAGVAKGTIYLYFDSKETLFEEVVREQLLPHVNETENLVETFEGSASQLLAEQLQNFYRMAGSEEIARIMSLVIGEGARFPALSSFVFNEIISRNQQAMRKTIKMGVASGEFRAARLEDFTQILMAPVIISAIWGVQFQHLLPVDMESYARTHIDLLLNGLRVPHR